MRRIPVQEQCGDAVRMARVLITASNRGLRKALEIHRVNEHEYAGMLSAKSFYATLRRVCAENDPDLDDCGL